MTCDSGHMLYPVMLLQQNEQQRMIFKNELDIRKLI